MKKLLILALCIMPLFCFSQNYVKIEFLEKDIHSVTDLVNTISGTPFSNYSDMKSAKDDMSLVPGLFGLSIKNPNVFIYKENGQTRIALYQIIKLGNKKAIWRETKMSGIQSLFIKKGTTIVSLQ